MGGEDQSNKTTRGKGGGMDFDIDKIDKIVNDIYDPEIEDSAKQALMPSIIKSWLRNAASQGVLLGRQEFADLVEVTIKQNGLKWGEKVFIYK